MQTSSPCGSAGANLSDVKARNRRVQGNEVCSLEKFSLLILFRGHPASGWFAIANRAQQKTSLEGLLQARLPCC